MCGACCREKWDIDVEPEIMQQLEKIDWTPEIPKNRRLFKKRPTRWVMETEKGACLFLKDNKCMIHSRLGEHEKPTTCIDFPYMFTETPDGVVVGLTYSCPQAAANKGQPLSENIGLEGWAERSAKNGKVHGIRLVLNGQEIRWETYKRLEERLKGILELKRTMRHRLLLAHKLIEETQDNMGRLDEYLKNLDVEGLTGRTDTTGTNPSKKRTILAVTIAILSHQREKNPLSTIATYLRYARTNDTDKAMPAEWEENETTDRYIEHVIDRKTLIAGGDIADNLNILILAYTALEWHSKANAAKDGRKKPSQNDLIDAIMTIEKKILIHNMTYRILVGSKTTEMLMGYFLNDPEYARIMLGD